MPLALSDLFKFRDVYETAIAAVLATATGGAVHVSQSTASKTALWIDVDFDAGKSIKHKALYNGGYYDDIYTGAVLTVRVCSNRQTSGQIATHKTYAAKIIVVMTPGIGKFTTSNLPYHQLIDTTFSGESFGVIEEQDLDVTELKWECAHGIRPEAWAQVTTNNTNLSVFTVNSSSVADGQTVTLGNGTTSATVVATPQDPSATVGTITGNTGLSTGDNALSFTVTAADGVNTRDYHLTLHVLNTGTAEITQFHIPGSASGQSLVFSVGVIRHGVYFTELGAGSQPDLSAYGVTNYVQVDTPAFSNWTGNFQNAINVLVGVTCSAGGTTATLTCSSVGAQVDAVAVGGACSVTITQQGADPS